MSRLLDALPGVEARIRMQYILEFLGCTRLGCTLDGYDDIGMLARVVKHNDQVRSFEYMATAHAHDRRALVVRPGTMELVATLPLEICEWVREQHEQHEQIKEQREQERQAAISDDPWIEHAVMLACADSRLGS